MTLSPADGTSLITCDMAKDLIEDDGMNSTPNTLPVDGPRTCVRRRFSSINWPACGVIQEVECPIPDAIKDTYGGYGGYDGGYGGGYGGAYGAGYYY